MYKNQTYAREPRVQPKDAESLPETKRPLSRSYELLWRKKSTKLHKTWEGDAHGAIKQTPNGYEMAIERDDGLKIGTVRLGKEVDSVSDGTLLSTGSYELEVVSTAHEGPPKKVRVPSIHDISTSKKPLMSKLDKPLIQPTSMPGLLSSSTRSATTRVSPETSEEPNRQKTSSIASTKPKTARPKASLGMTGSFRVPSKLSNASILHKANDRPGTQGEMLEGIVPNLLAKLRPHQVEGVEFMRRSVLGNQHNRGYGCILADEMGLGKTLTAIALVHTLLKNKEINNALIVCPVTLISNWKNEFQKWLNPFSESPVRPQIGVMTVDQNGWGNGSLRDPIAAFFGDRHFKMHQVMILGYERVRMLSNQMAQKNTMFDLVICDEGHRLKSSNSRTAESIDSISAEKRVLLTGTPVQNDLTELWSIANFVNPGCFGTEAKFVRKFVQPISAQFHAVHTSDRALVRHEGNDNDNDDDNNENDDENDGYYDEEEDTLRSEISFEEEAHVHSRVKEQAEESLRELTEICEEFMLRRTTTVLEKYMHVPKTEYIVFCRPADRQIEHYESLLSGASNLLVGNAVDQGACLRAISELRKVANGYSSDSGAKMRVLSAILDELRARTDEKVVIVSGSTRVLDMCQQLCAGKNVSWLRLDGSTPQDKRQSSVDIFNKFSSSRALAFLLSSRSGGMGLNLIGGSRLVLMDCDWNPAVDAQVMSRIHRDGQKRSCYIYRLMTTGTIDEKIFQRQLSKIGLSTNVLLGSSHIHKTEFSRDVLKDLFTLSFPAKCNTLEAAYSDAQIKGYHEQELGELKSGDLVLGSVLEKTGIISCILSK